MRNPFSIGVSPDSGVIFVNDIASFEGSGGTPNSDRVPREEINFVPSVASLTTELNYGWPATEGAGTNIVHTYRNGSGEDVVGSDCAIVGGTFYKPDTARFPSTVKFPATYDGAYFFGDHCSGWLKYLPADKQTPQTVAGNPPGVTPNTPLPFATQVIQGLVDLQASPDGSLYYLTRAIVQPRDPNVNGLLVKVTYSTVPSPETCAITAPGNGTRLVAPADIAITATASDSQGDGIAKVEFLSTTVNVAGSPTMVLATDTSAPYQHTMTALRQNVYQLTARCTNVKGGTKDSAPVTVTINGPTANINTPANGTMYNAGDTINVSGTGTDVEDGTLPASAFEWIIELGHGVGASAHYHEEFRLLGTSGTFVVPRTGELDPLQFQRINLQVVDSAGIFHTVFRDIFPNKSDVTLTTNPAGLSVTLDGTDRVTPLTFTSVVGMERELIASSPQTLDGKTYAFVSWSDGGAASHTMTVPAANPTITAVYREAMGSTGGSPGSGGTTGAAGSGGGGTSSGSAGAAGAPSVSGGSGGCRLSGRATSDLAALQLGLFTMLLGFAAAIARRRD